jgi:integrase
MDMTIPPGMFLRGTVWYTRKDIPEPLQPLIGVTSRQRRLGTDFKLARVQHYLTMAEFEQEIANARAELALPPMQLTITRKDGTSQTTALKRAPDFIRALIPTGSKLPQVFDKWVLARDPTTNTVNETQRAMRQFIALNGDLVMPEYTVKHARAWRDYIAAADSAHGTKIKRFAAVTNLFRWGWKNDFVQDNPFERVQLDRPRRARAAKRPEWTLSELRTWFNSPIYTEGYRPKQGEAAFWLPILGLFMGCRLGELCQADLTDLKEDSGIHYLMIRPSDEDEDEDAKSVKTEDSERKVPIHRRALDLGWLDYVATLDGTKLFPKVRPDSRGRWSGRFSNWFGEYRRKLGIDQRWTDFHAFRATWKTAARGMKLPEDLHDAITGHENGSVGRTYGGIPITQLKSAVDLVDFDITIPNWKKS